MNSQSYRNLKLSFKKIFWYSVLLKNILLLKLKYNNNFSRPYKLLISMTQRCNFNCRICGIWKKVSLDDDGSYYFDDIFLKYKNIQFLTITGGEPFIDSEKLFKILNQAKKSCKNLYYISINTNGYFTKNINEVLDKILNRYSFLKIVVGLSYIPNNEWGIQRTGVRDAYNRSRETIRCLDGLMRQYDKRISYYKIFTVASSDDFNLIKKDLGDVWLNFAEINNFYNNEGFDKIINLNNRQKEKLIKENFRILFKSASLLNKIYLYILKKNIRSGRLKIKCYAGKNRMYIDSSGEEFICSRGVKSVDEKKREFCKYCWTPCEAVFDIIQGLY